MAQLAQNSLQVPAARYTAHDTTQRMSWIVCFRSFATTYESSNISRHEGAQLLAGAPKSIDMLRLLPQTAIFTVPANTGPSSTTEKPFMSI